MSNEGVISVSKLLQKVNNFLQIKRDESLSSECICMFRLYENSLAECKVHRNRSTCSLICNIINTFAYKKIIYVKTFNSIDIIYNQQIRFMLPFTLYVEQDIYGKYYLLNEILPKQLNVHFLILNIIYSCKTYGYHNFVFNDDNMIIFKYMLVVNCKLNKPQKYIQCKNEEFILYVGKMLSNNY